MNEKKQVATTNTTSSLFDKQNMWLMLLGVGVIAIGMLLMVGGRSNDPNTFNYDEVYSTLRISVAPVLIIIGLGIEIYAIFKKPKA
ncbi:MAG: DUF3098 domain-containing protein [Bacteroidetes bacterium]|jgi:hypothetical protein|nr:MAG: DUF3098 domain-containing protein [Bacteroidota bacterium]